MNFFRYVLKNPQKEYQSVLVLLIYEYLSNLRKSIYISLNNYLKFRVINEFCRK